MALRWLVPTLSISGSCGLGAAGAFALKAQREGWLGHAVRRTVGPMAVIAAVTILIGLAVGHWMPEARTLPQAMLSLF